MRYRILILTLLFCLPFTLTRAQPDQSQPDGRVLLMDTRLRLRDAPSFSSNTLDSLDPGAPLTLIGRTADSDWLYIRTQDGLVGWSNAAYITVNIDLSNLAVTTDLTALSHPLHIAPKVA